MPRFLSAAALVGAALGALFARAVVAVADCPGPGCTAERVTGVLGHALGGALLGALLGAVAYGLRRLLHRLRR